MKELTQGSVRANGIRFEYLETGKGPLALCLHGFPDHAPSFRHQLPALAAAGFRAVAPWMRGYAPTEIPAGGPFQTAALALDVVGLVDALSPGEPAVVVGHDWGAVAAYGAAVHSPARIRKLVTIAVPYGPSVLQAITTSYRQMKRSWYMFMFQLPTAEMAVSHEDFAFLEHIWADWSPGWSWPSADMESLKRTFRQPGVLEAALGYYRHMFNPAFQVPDLAPLQMRIMSEPIGVPTLYVHGERDGCIGVELVEGMEGSFPNGFRKLVVPGAGHFVHEEKPDAVNQALVEFVKDAR
jgi:pimeloyl-ACP methyl ester carboxylesterase